jgi:phospholipid/cholesterol/gamma-HCH transport system substrate-binding protein
MRRRQVIAQLIVFAVISVVIIAYTVFDLLDVHLTNSPYSVTVQLNQAGGIYEGAEVAYRGVQVGTVSSMKLETSGVTIKLEIDHGTKVPDNAIAHIYDLSAVGEQYVDLTPTGPSSTYLHGGSVIPANRTTTPRETASVLYDLERFIDSINPTDVQIIGREGAAAFQGTGPQLKSILSDTTRIIDQLSASADSTVGLLHNASILLHGAAAHSGDFDQFASSLYKITTTLAQSTPTLNKFLDQAAPATRLINRIIADNGSALTVLLSNLATLSDIQVVRIPALRSLLIAVPEFGRKAPTVVHDGALVGAANINQDQALCNTGLPLSNPISGQRSPIYAVNCGTGLVRGAANAPRASSSTGTNVERAVPLGASARPTASGDGQVGGYDASTGLLSTGDGTLLRLGTNGGQEVLLGPNSWQAMLLAVTGG